MKKKKNSLKEIIGKKVVSVLTIFSKTLSSKVIYRIHTKKKLNLDNPTLFNEKLMYLKLNDYYKNPLVIKGADKVLVRDYVKDCGCSELLTKIYGVYNDAKEIDFDSLPDKFVLKCNHGCGYNIICTDKNTFDKESAIKKLNKWKKQKFGYETCETHYFKIKPLIFVEEYIETEAGIMPNDYKIYCFNGKAKVVLVCSERDEGVKVNFFDLDWNELFYRDKKYRSTKKILKPNNLNKMIKYAEKLSKPFPFVRVDFYDDSKRVIFGELTFTPARCCADYNEYGSLELGQMLDLKKYKKKK